MNIGDIGTVRWTNSLKFYKGRAEVTKVNAKTLRAKLLEDVPSQFGGEPYKAEREIIVPIPGTPYNRFDAEAT
jgi:hypothetical protein